MASVSETLVNRLMTSKLTFMFSAKVVPRMHLANAKEFFTYDSVFPVKGVRILVSSLAKLWVGEPIAETISLSGVSLWMLGRPYGWGE